jgi:hypothetical protein
MEKISTHTIPPASHKTLSLTFYQAVLKFLKKHNLLSVKFYAIIKL